MGHQLAYLTLVLYAVSCALYVRVLYAPQARHGWLPTFFLGAAIVCQYFALLERSHWIHSIPYDDLYGSMSLFAWLLVARRCL